jgi:integrase
MPRRKGLTDKQIDSLPRQTKRTIIADPELRGLYLRIPPADTNAPITYTVVARDPHGRQIWTAVGTTSDLKIDQARAKARETLGRIKAGLPPTEPPKPVPDSVVVVADNWLARVVDKERHRTGGETRRIIGKYIVPHIGDRVFAELRRSEIARLLDLIEDQHGARTADRTLATLRSIANWIQSRDDDYVSPFVRGMRRSTNGARDRILSDDEIRKFWQATRSTGTGAALRLLLLTGQRRAKVLEMRWKDIGIDGTWSIPTAPREKGNPGTLKLPKVALDLIRKQPHLSERIFDFHKTTLEAAKAAIGDWHIHDLRRTARSLMSRAGVQSEHAERVLGHAIGGVEGVYDRHRYDNEKTRALEKLAALIQRIANPPAQNVVALQTSA